MRVLLVEDSEFLRWALAAVLQGPGRVIDEAGDAEAALALAGAGRYDVVVSDVDLPGRSGIDLARTLLASDPGQRIVLCSGHDLRDALDDLGGTVSAVPKDRADLELPERLRALEQERTG